MKLRLTAAVAVLIILSFTSVPSVHAQPTPSPVPPGQIVWSFGYENPLFDERVASALGALMEPHIVSVTPPATRIVRVRQEGPGVFVAGSIQPASDVPKLLAAAGYGSSPPFVVTGPCKVWASPPTASAQSDLPRTAGVPIVSRALQTALASLGVAMSSCEVTASPAEAHLLIWVSGTAAPDVLLRGGRAGTLLAPPNQSARPAPSQGGNVVPFPDDPRTPVPKSPATGNAGLQAPPSAVAPASAGLLALALFLAVGARCIQRQPKRQ
jgi:hypothetical protein